MTPSLPELALGKWFLVFLLYPCDVDSKKENILSNFNPDLSKDPVVKDTMSI